MKKIYLLTAIAITLTISSCSKPGITEFRAYLLPEKLTLIPGASSFITLRIEVPDNAHIYGNPKGPGTGKATEVTASGPEIISFGEPRFPRAHKYINPGEKDFVWVNSGTVDITQPLTISNKAKTGIYNIKVKLEALECTDTTCIPRNIDFNHEITVSADTMHQKAIDSSLIQSFNDTPKSPIVKKDPVQTKQPESTESFDGITLEPRCIEERKIAGLIEAILLGLLAGIILNIMPCVLPVVSLKIMGFVQHAGSDRRELFILGVIFSLGILTSFAILAGLAAFFGYSWGELFQNRTFLVVMAAVIFALGLSMFHVYTINIPGFAGKAAAHEQGNKHVDAFVKGLLATLLATPCSGPFLGGTLAWALAQPPHIIFVIFMSIGTGMALPYLVMSINPALIKRIPKPGPWLKSFEQVMGFLLMFTVIYLIAVAGQDIQMPAITFLGFVAIGFWQYGTWGSPIQPKLKRVISLFVLIVILAGGYLISFNYLYSNQTAVELKGNEFSAQRVMNNRNNGVISIIKFTADWCPNCRLVENISLNTVDVQKLIAENNIDFMTADITRNNPPAEKLLMLMGSRSIPALAIIPHGDLFTKPFCLRDIYTENEVLKAIRTVLDETGKSDIKKNINDNTLEPLFNVKIK